MASSHLSPQDLQSINNNLIAIAKLAGTLILAATPTPLTTTSKKNSPSSKILPSHLLLI